SNRISFFLALKVLRFQLRALAFELLLIGFICTKRLALWEQEVTSISVLTFDGVAHLAQTANTFQKNDFHWSFLSSLIDLAIVCFRKFRHRRTTRSIEKPKNHEYE